MRLHLAILFSLLILPALALAEPEKDSQKVPTKEDFVTTLKVYGVWAKNVTNPEAYEKVVLENKDDKKSMKFTELSEMDKDFFYLIQYERLDNGLFHINQFWEFEHQRAPEETDDENAVTKKDVEQYQAQLLELRKDVVVGFEEYAAKCFEKHAENIPMNERETYLTKLKAWHDREKLVERE